MCTTAPPPFVSILELPFIDSEHVRTNLQILHGPTYLRVVLQKLIKSGVSNGAMDGPPSGGYLGTVPNELLGQTHGVYS